MQPLQFLKPDSCCLHLVDLQTSLMRKIEGADRVAATTAYLIKIFKALGLPIIANTQYKKGLGGYVPELESLLDGVPCIDKVEFSGFDNPETIRLIEAMPQVKNWVLVGIEAHVCVYQTALGALRRGMTPWIIVDGVGSRHSDDLRVGLRRMEMMGAVLITSEMALYELLGRAGTPQFKSLMPLVIERDNQLAS
ncbi:MAG: isochorismatase family protein [Desulfobulbaceae bacterium]|jgi:nicotinamidase-related amidase|nr:isochorismatase family protein [Desulfobulbaceae bacterium]